MNITKQQIEDALTQQTITDAMHPTSIGHSSLWLGTREILVEAIEEKVLRNQRTTPKCFKCDAPSSCVGAYINHQNGAKTPEIHYACDEHCGHGNKGGWCKPLLAPVNA